MKLPVIRAYIGDWVYYVATMRFKDVSEYVNFGVIFSGTKIKTQWL